MKKFACSISMTLLLAAVGQVQAAKIYTCIINGDTVYTSTPQGNCRSADLPSIGRYSSARTVVTQNATAEVAPVYKAPKAKVAKMPAAASAPAPMTTATPPPVKATGGRRQILEQELENERRALADAQKALTAGRSVSGQSGAQHQSNVRQLESAVLDRQQNIQALQRELGRM